MIQKWVLEEGVAALRVRGCRRGALPAMHCDQQAWVWARQGGTHTVYKFMCVERVMAKALNTRGETQTHATQPRAEASERAAAVVNKRSGEAREVKRRLVTSDHVQGLTQAYCANSCSLEGRAAGVAACALEIVRDVARR